MKSVLERGDLDTSLLLYANWVGREDTLPGRRAILEGFGALQDHATAERMILRAVALEDASVAQGGRDMTGVASWFLSQIYRSDPSRVPAARDELRFSSNPRVQQVLASSLPNSEGLADDLVSVYRSATDGYLRRILLGNIGSLGSPAPAFEAARLAFRTPGEARGGCRVLVHLVAARPEAAPEAATIVAEFAMRSDIDRNDFAEALCVVDRIDPAAFENLVARLYEAPPRPHEEIQRSVEFAALQRLQRERRSSLGEPEPPY